MHLNFQNTPNLDQNSRIQVLEQRTGLYKVERTDYSQKQEWTAV